MLTARIDYRQRPTSVNLNMPLVEFRELVEMLEYHAPNDGATVDFRLVLDEVDPPSDDTKQGSE